MPSLGDHRPAILAERGVSLIEATISAAILITVILGVMSSFNYYQNKLTAGRAMDGLTKLRGDILDRIQNQSSWRATVMNGASFQCIRDFSDCSAVAGDFALDIVNDDGTMFITAASRFKVDGRPCVGNDLLSASLDLYCPITFTVTGNFNCPGANCYPTATSVRVIPQVTEEFSQRYGQLNVGVAGCKYCLDLNRGMDLKEQSFSVFEERGNDGTGPGFCTPNVWTTRNLTQADDPESVILGLVGGAVNLPAGWYRCRAEAPAYGVGAFSIRPYVDGGPLQGESGIIFTGSGFAPDHATEPAKRAGGVAFVQFEMRQAADFNLTIRQLCTTSHSAKDLGNEVGAIGASTIYTRVDCRRTY